MSWANGILGQFRPIAVKINSDCATPDKLTNITAGPFGAGRNGIVLELDAGAANLANGTGSPQSDFFVADYPYMINTPGSGYSLTETLTATGGTCSVSKTLQVTGIDSAGGISAYALTPGTCSVTPTGWSGTPGSGFTTYPDIFIATAVAANRLNISNNAFPKTTLYLENSVAAASTTGCGNVFVAATPYLCPVPAQGLVPGGRLTLCTTPPCAPVMTVAIAGATSVYYVPYTGQNVPIYNAQAGSFGPVDIGPAGLVLNLDSADQIANELHDIFVETSRTGTSELCTSTHWTGSVHGAALAQIQGIWVNSASFANCHVTAGTDTACAVAVCTYLGTIYMVANGQTSQTIGPIYSSGTPNASCLCVYNAYNHVTLAAQWLDSGASYTYGSTTWRPSRNLNNGRITVVDGLAQMSIFATINDSIIKGSVGLDLNSTTATPAFFAQASATAAGSYPAVLTSQPVQGVWYVQAMESANSGTTATFGGASLQQIGVQLED